MAAAAPVGGGRGNGHHHIQPDQGKKGAKRKADEDPVPAAHVDKKSTKAPQLPTLSKAQQDHVTRLIQELHDVATPWSLTPQIARLQSFFYEKEGELDRLNGKVSPIAALRFLHSDSEVKTTAIKVFESISLVSWTAINRVVAGKHKVSLEPKILEEVRLLKAHDPIAKDWNEDAIMKHVREEDPKALIKHIFPEANI